MLLRFHIITVTIFPALIKNKYHHGDAQYENFISINPDIFNLQIAHIEKTKTGRNIN